MIYDQWFDQGIFDKEVFFEKYPVNTDEFKVKRAFNQHKQWKEQSG